MYVDGFECFRRVDMRGDGRDFAIQEGHIANRAEFVFRIDNVAALQQQIVFRLGRRLCLQKTARSQREE